jgi:uncharacterized protein YjbJ (UPF0337 family)
MEPVELKAFLAALWDSEKHSPFLDLILRRAENANLSPHRFPTLPHLRHTTSDFWNPLRSTSSITCLQKMKSPHVLFRFLFLAGLLLSALAIQSTSANIIDKVKEVFKADPNKEAAKHSQRADEASREAKDENIAAGEAKARGHGRDKEQEIYPTGSHSDRMRQGVEEVKQGTHDIYESAKDRARQGYEKVKATAGDAAETVKEAAGYAKETAAEAAARAAGAAKGTAQEVKETAKSGYEYAKETAESAAEKARRSYDYAKEKTSEGAEYVKDAASDAAGYAKEKAYDAKDTAKAGYEYAKDTAETAAEKAKSAAERTFVTFLSWILYFLSHCLYWLTVTIMPRRRHRREQNTSRRLVRRLLTRPSTLLKERSMPLQALGTRSNSLLVL